MRYTYISILYDPNDKEEEKKKKKIAFSYSDQGET